MTPTSIMFGLPLLMLFMMLVSVTIANMIKFTYKAILERDYNFLAQALVLTILPIVLVYLCD